MDLGVEFAHRLRAYLHRNKILNTVKTIKENNAALESHPFPITYVTAQHCSHCDQMWDINDGHVPRCR